MPTLEAVALPDHLTPDQLSGKVAVVIDVLRATTTIVHALGEGASCVLPVASVEGARMIAHEREGALLCGERGGVKPEGFAMGNSPLEYTRPVVGGRACVLSTTNGTRAMHMATGAREVVIGAITNLGAVCAYLSAGERGVVLVCSGTDGLVTLEDCIGAGLMVDRLGGFDADDSALLMREAAAGAIARWGGLEGAVASSFHARRLVGMGFGDDVRYASGDSVSGVVPVFDPATGEIGDEARWACDRG